MVNVFFSISSSVTFSNYSFNYELILNNAELYSLTVLNSCNLRCIQSYLASRRITIFWWSYLLFNSFHRVRGSFTIRYSLFKSLWRWCRKKISAFALSYKDACFPSLMEARRFIASKYISIKDPREVVLSGNVKCHKLKFCDI